MVETSILTPRAVLAIGMVAALGAVLATLAARERAAVAPLPAPELAATEAGQTADPAADPAAAAERAAKPEAPVSDAAAADPADATTVPSFDVVRVTPEGAALVAGRAAPGATVTVRAGEAEVAVVEAGPTGEFVAIFKAPLADSPRALTLESGGVTGGAVSQETVLLLPPAPPPAVATADASAAEGWTSAAGNAGAAADETEGPAGEVEIAAAAIPGEAAASQSDPGPEADVAATAILREDEVEVIAPPQAAGGRLRVSLASISYGEAGAVTLAGFGTAGAAVRVYVDGDHSVDGAIDAGGRWRLALGDIAAGIYRLRVDEVGPDGRVVSRVETPFQRDFPELAPSPGDGEQKITVQPGNNLWTIARERYGQGVHYTQIFTANAALITDPELIYPGQIFVLPFVEGAGEPVVEGPLPRP